jgi:hypothetical protein
MKNFGNYTKIEIKKLTFEQPMDWGEKNQQKH